MTGLASVEFPGTYLLCFDDLMTGYNGKASFTSSILVVKAASP